MVYITIKSVQQIYVQCQEKVQRNWKRIEAVNTLSLLS